MGLTFPVSQRLIPKPFGMVKRSRFSISYRSGRIKWGSSINFKSMRYQHNTGTGFNFPWLPSGGMCSSSAGQELRPEFSNRSENWWTEMCNTACRGTAVFITVKGKATKPVKPEEIRWRLKEDLLLLLALKCLVTAAYSYTPGRGIIEQTVAILVLLPRCNLHPRK